MNDAEADDIDDGKKFHLPNGFVRAVKPGRWMSERQMKLDEALVKDTERIKRERIMKAIGDHGKAQKPKHQAPGD